MKRGMIKLTLEELKSIIGEDIKIIPVMVQKSWCGSCGVVNMEEYGAYIDKKNMELLIVGNCNKCGSEIVRCFDDDSGVIADRIKKMVENKNIKKDKESKIDSEEVIFQFKIELKGLRPPVWRRFLVGSNVTFYQFHNIIQQVMGWENYHMYQFVLGRNSYILDNEDDADGFFGVDIQESDKVKLSDIFKSEKQKIVYEYDFGDGWEHRITLEKIVEREENVVYPVCIAGKRGCPPEDVGGLGGYEYFLEVIKNPEHEDYEEMIQYSGDDFDPEEFDLKFINEMLEDVLDA